MSLTAYFSDRIIRAMNTPTLLVARLHVDLMRVVASGCR